MYNYMYIYTHVKLLTCIATYMLATYMLATYMLATYMYSYIHA